MEHTSNRTLAQVCDIMSVFMRAQADTVREYVRVLPKDSVDELQRLGGEMWEMIQRLKQEAEATEAALCDPAFVAFKSRLLTKPRRTRRAKKQIA